MRTLAGVNSLARNKYVMCAAIAVAMQFRWSVLFGHVVIAWLTLSRDSVGKDEGEPKVYSLHAPEWSQGQAHDIEDQAQAAQMLRGRAGRCRASRGPQALDR